MTVTAATYKPNPALDAEAQHTAEMAAALRYVAEEIASDVRNIAPRSSEAGEHYADMITVEDFEGVVVVKANKWTSGFVEFGTSFTPTYAPLRRAAEMNGLTVRSSGF